MNNIFKFQLNDIKIDLKQGEFYLVKTSIECIEGILIKNSNLDKEKTVIINSFSEYMDTILLSKYYEKNKKMLKKQGFNNDFGICNTAFFKLLISNEKAKYNTLFINTVGLSYESIEELSSFLLNLVNSDNKTIFLVNYNSSNSEKCLEIYDNRKELLYNINNIG